MAELSTLSPSPPALSDPHAAPPVSLSSPPLPAANSPALESTRDIPLPKSSLYNDKSLTGNTPAVQPGASLVMPCTSSSPPTLPSETHSSSVVHNVAPQREDSTETACHVIKDETRSSEPGAAQALNTETPALSNEPPSQCEVQLASPSPVSNPGPNLYPSVHVTHNSKLDVDDDDDKVLVKQPQAAAASNQSSAPSASPDVTATAEEKKLQPLQQAHNAQSSPPPVSPKPDSASEGGKAEPPTTPTRAEHPSPTVPLIHEPAFPLPNPKPAPALDTLSYLESASLMSGTLESLSGLGEDGSSVGSDSEVNGLTVRRTDKYGFLGGSQYSEGG